MSMYRTHAPTYVASEEGPNTVPAQVGPSRETTSSHLLGIDSRIPSSSLQFYFMYNWYSSYADLSIPSASIPITKQKCTKPYDSFPNQKSVDSHHNSFKSLTLRFWYIGRTKSGKIRSGSPLEIPPDSL